MNLILKIKGGGCVNANNMAEKKKQLKPKKRETCMGETKKGEKLMKHVSNRHQRKPQPPIPLSSLTPHLILVFKRHELMWF